MSCRIVTISPDWPTFRKVARTLLMEGVAPESIVWSEERRDGVQLGLGEPASSPGPPLALEGMGTDDEVVGRRREAVRVPRTFLELGDAAACYRDPPAWPCLYRLLWRIERGDRWVLDDDADPDMSRARSMERAVRRDSHKMTAFVRFRSVGRGDQERFVAWFEPRHRIVRRTAPFFVRRFPSMRWSILTPDECVHWEGSELTFTPGVDRRHAPTGDELESFWLTYYTHTFNPARVRFSAMRAEMPVHYWRNLPEAASINDLLRGAPGRVREMIERAGNREGDSSAGGEACPSVGGPPASTSIDGSRVKVGDSDHRPVAGVQVLASNVSREPPANLRPIRVPGVRVGVAGWDYPDWAGRVYPEGRDGIDRLRWVSARFDLLEVNSTFYRPVSERAARGWLERVADRPELRFAAKLSRVFTHEREIWKESEVAAVKRGVIPLMEEGRLISLVAQFPWSFRDSPEGRRHLARIASAFAEFPLHFEVRHASWARSPLYGWLQEQKLGVVNIDQPLFTDSIPPGSEVTSRIAYVRLHGRNADNWFRADAGRDERYDYDYPPAELDPWVKRVRGMVEREDVDEVEVVFNNHYRGQAVRNAEWFAAALKRELGADAVNSGDDFLVIGGTAA